MTASRWRGVSVLVTGGRGFIGSHLVDRLAQQGARVTSLDLCQRWPVPDGADDVRGDLADPEVAGRVIVGQEVVFHLAARLSHRGSMTDPWGDLRDNTMATLALAEAARRQESPPRIIATSTRQIYGRPDRLPVDEDHALRPPDVNGIHKLAAEQYLRLYGHVYGLQAVSLRLTNIYGPRIALHEGDFGVVSALLRRALGGQEMVLHDDGRQVRDFTYVDDVVDALLLAADADALVGQTVNLGCGTAYSLRDLAEAIVAIAPVPCRFQPESAAAAAIAIGDYVSDPSRLIEATGWQPKVTLADGIARTLAWARDGGRA